jgi:hypothetical protein
MIYVAETDRQAREEFEPHFWYLARKGLRLPREYIFPPATPRWNPSFARGTPSAGSSRC